MLLLMKSKQLIENWLFNIIPKIILATKKLIKNLLRSIKLITLFVMSLKERTMIT